MPEIIQKGEIEKGSNRVFLNTNDKRAVVALDYKGEKNNWVVTAYINEPKANVSAYPHQNIQTLNTSSTIVEKPLNSNAIIPHSKPFASTKANFTKEQWQNLTTQEKIKAFKDQIAREKAQIAEAQAQEQAKREALYKKKIESIQAQRDSNAGKAINEVDLNLGDSIEYTHLKPTRINLENKDYPAEFVIINKEDLKPNFNTTGTQGRTQKQENVIKDIQNNLKPNKLFFSEGGFDGLPIVLQDGSIAVGNHRAEALKNLSKESLEVYKKSAKEVFNVDLKDNELIVRMLDKDTPKQEILNLRQRSRRIKKATFKYRSPKRRGNAEHCIKDA